MTLWPRLTSTTCIARPFDRADKLAKGGFRVVVSTVIWLDRNIHTFFENYQSIINFHDNSQLVFYRSWNIFFHIIFLYFFVKDASLFFFFNWINKNCHKLLHKYIFTVLTLKKLFFYILTCNIYELILKKSFWYIIYTFTSNIIRLLLQYI